MLSKKKEETTTEDILDEINKNAPLNLQVSTDKYSKGDNKFVDKAEWKKGIYVIETTEEAVILVEVLEFLPSEQKELSDTKGKVIADYQTYLENTWLTELRSKYTVTVNQEALYSIIK